MTPRTPCQGLQVATILYRFVEDKVLPGTGIGGEQFWSGFAAIVRDLTPKNTALLAERDRLQTDLDAWHSANPGPIADMLAYRDHLESIGYLTPVPPDFTAETTNVDAELAIQAGPQLVVPILNARYSLNAANARYDNCQPPWTSKYAAIGVIANWPMATPEVASDNAVPRLRPTNQ